MLFHCTCVRGFSVLLRVKCNGLLQFLSPHVLMHCGLLGLTFCPSVRPSGTGPKLTRKKNYGLEKNNLHVICNHLLDFYWLHWLTCLALACGLTSTSNCIFVYLFGVGFFVQIIKLIVACFRFWKPQGYPYCTSIEKCSLSPGTPKIFLDSIKSRHGTPEKSRVDLKSYPWTPHSHW